MAVQKVPYPAPGIAAFEKLDDYVAGFLLSGSWPVMSTGYPMRVKADTTLKQFSVVTMGVGGLELATKAGAKPVGILTDPVTGASDGSTTVPVIYSGCFDPEALVWDDSFATAADKAKAFEGAASPTQVLIRARG